MTKDSVCLTPYLRNRTSYDCDFWYTRKMISPAKFSFFKILIFGIFREVKGQKMTQNYQFQFVLLYISGTVDHIIETWIMISTGVFVYIVFKKCNIVSIKIILFFIGPLQQLFS